MNTAIYRYLGGFFLTTVLFISACTTTGPSTTASWGIPSPYTQSVEHYQRMADSTVSTERAAFTIQAAGRLLEDGMTDRASQLLDSVSQAHLPHALAQEKDLLNAEIALHKQQPRQTINTLARLQGTSNLSPYQRAKYHQLRAQAFAQLGEHASSARERLLLAHVIDNPTGQQLQYDAAWQQLSYLSSEELGQAIQSTPSGELRGWLEIVAVSKLDTNNDYVLQNEINRWQARYPNHPASSNVQQITPTLQGSQQIALLLPAQGNLASAGQAVRDGFMHAYYQDTKNSRHTQVRFYDSTQGNITNVYRQAINDGANLVVGPLDKSRVQTLINSDVMNDVPTITLNYSGREVQSANVYQFGLSPQDEIQQIVQRAQREGKRRAAVITPNDRWGKEQAQSFTQKWQQAGGQIVTSLNYSSGQDLNESIKNLLNIADSEQREQSLQETLGRQVEFQPQRRQDIDMIFLVALPNDARQIQPLLKYYYAGSIPVYSPSVIYSGVPDPIRDQDLDGIRFLDIPWVFNPTHEHQSNTRLYALGVDAYDLSQRLSRFNALPRSRFTGETGLLSLTPDQNIYRELVWGEFKQGRAQKG